MPSPAASVEARAVMMDTWAQPPDDGTAWAGLATTALRTRLLTTVPVARIARRLMDRDGFTGTPLFVVGFRWTTQIPWVPGDRGCAWPPARSGGASSHR